MPHQIFIRPEVFGAAIDVIVEPPVAAYSIDREFPVVAEARAYAAGVAAVSGWPIIDEAGIDQ